MKSDYNISTQSYDSPAIRNAKSNFRSDLSQRVVIVTNTGWNAHRFRTGLLRELVSQNWSVTVVADFRDGYLDEIAKIGTNPVSISVDAAGTNPLRDLQFFLSLCRIYRAVTPQVVHHFTLKPLIYGSLAARVLRVPRIINTLTGRSSASGMHSSAKSQLVARLVKVLYGMALSEEIISIFQNPDDFRHFVDCGLCKSRRSIMIPGSGVDMSALVPAPDIPVADRHTVIMACRMLWSKGVKEFVEAATMLKQEAPWARFLLIGGAQEDYGSKNADFVPRAWLEARTRDGVVEWLGRLPPTQVENLMRRAAMVVLPSYYPEGVPRTLIEAAAAGAPIVTTDMPGCREVVVDGVTGYLCAPRSTDSLAASMRRVLQNPQVIPEMGRAGRTFAEEKFDEAHILAQIMRLYTEALN